MDSPKEHAITLLKQSEIPLDVVDRIAPALEDAPIDDRGEVSFPVLRARYGDKGLKVSSRRIANVVVNWREILSRLAGSGIPPISPHPDPLNLLHMILYGLRVVH